jgi:hypothetical protein
MDVVLKAPSLSQEALLANVREDFDRFERETEHLEPNPALMLFPSRHANKANVEDGHDILQWSLGATAEQMDQVYGVPLRIVPLNNGQSARLYVARSRCGSFVAAIFLDGSLATVFSHQFFDPRFWLDLLGEKHSPPWNPFEILRSPSAT